MNLFVKIKTIKNYALPYNFFDKVIFFDYFKQ